MKIHLVPWLWPMSGITLGNHVFVRDESLVPHETVHWHQQRIIGLPLFLFLYCCVLPLLWNPWRVRWEAEAYAVDVKNGTLSLDAAAKILSSSLYLWPVSYEDARKRILAALAAGGVE